MGGGRLVQDGKVKRCTVWPAIPFTVSNDTRMHGYWLTDLLYGLKPSPIMIQFIANAASLGRWGPFRSAPVFLQQAPHSHPSWSVTLLLTPRALPAQAAFPSVSPEASTAPPHPAPCTGIQRLGTKIWEPDISISWSSQQTELLHTCMYSNPSPHTRIFMYLSTWMCIKNHELMLIYLRFRCNTAEAVLPFSFLYR